MNHKILQAYYDEISRHYLDDGAEPIDVSFNLNHPLREYNIFKTLLQNGVMRPENGPVGLISWKFKAKTLIEVKEFSTLCEKAFAQGADVAFINPMVGAEAIYKNVWEQGELAGHKGMLTIASTLFSEHEMRQMDMMPQSKFALCNYFVANDKFWSRYIAFCDVILSKIDAFKETNPDIFALIHRKGDYYRAKSTDFLPFIIERLFSSFLMLNPDIRTANSQYSPYLYKKKFVELAAFISGLSTLKNTALSSANDELLKKWDELRRPALVKAASEEIWKLDDRDPPWTVKCNGMTLTVKEIDPGFGQMVERGDFESLLEKIYHLTYNLSDSPELMGRALFVPQLDDILYKISQSFVQIPVKPTADNLVVHIATEIGETGGLTRVIEDIALSFPEYQHILILTDTKQTYHLGHINLSLLEKRFAELKLEVIFLKNAKFTEKAKELAGYIAQLSPRAILIHPHHFDVIINASVSGKSAPRVAWFHHCDHKPCLGATRKDYIHLDTTPACYEACKTNNITSPKYISLSVEDRGIAPPGNPEVLIGATCGTSDKYFGRCEFTYGELLTALFAGGVHKMIHIGKVSDKQKLQILSEIQAGGQDSERITFIGDVPSLAKYLKEISPTFYLSSYPFGGGKSMIEALSLGLPIILPRTSNTPPLHNVDMALGGSLVIADLKDIPSVLAQMIIKQKMLRTSSREVYDQQYSMGVFRKKLLEII